MTADPPAPVPGPAPRPPATGWVAHTVTPVSPDDVVRVVGRALSGGTRRIRLTYGQRLAIVNAGPAPETAGA